MRSNKGVCSFGTVPEKEKKTVFACSFGTLLREYSVHFTPEQNVRLLPK